MLPLIRSEFRKLSTIRSPWLLLAAGPLIVVAGVTGLVQSGGERARPAVQSRALAHVGLAALFTLIFGILAVAGEYRHGTITDTFLSFPGRRPGHRRQAGRLRPGRRGRRARLVGRRHRGHRRLVGGQGRLLPALGGRHLADARRRGGRQLSRSPLIGVGVGALIRNFAAAVAAALAWIALVEGIAGQLTGPGLARWLPFYASEALGRAEPHRQPPAAARSGAAAWCCSGTPPPSPPPRCSLHSGAMSPRKPAVLRDGDGQNLREYLIATAARLIDQRGSAGLAVRDIAREAQVADGVLYNYFEDKEDLLAHALLAHVGTVMASLRPMPPAGTGTVAENLRLFIDAGLRGADPGRARVRRAAVPAQGAHPVPRDGRRGRRLRRRGGSGQTGEDGGQRRTGGDQAPRQRTRDDGGQAGLPAILAPTCAPSSGSAASTGPPTSTPP